MKVRIEKRLFFSLLVVLLWLGFVTTGAHALYTSSGSLADNVITTGTADLLVSNSQDVSPTAFEQTQTGFTYRLSPGETVENYFSLKNTSSGKVDYILSLATGMSNQSGDDAQIASMTTMTFYEVNSDGTLSQPSEPVTVSQAVQSPASLGFLLPHGQSKRYLVRTRLADEYGSQNQKLNFTLIFIGTQKIS